MIFSKACEYGIKAAVYIAEQSKQKKWVNIKDISEKINSPVAFTAKIMQQLVKAEIITSVKGATGGFAVDPKKLKKIKIKDVIFAIEKTKMDDTCVLGLNKCSESNPCPVHHKYKGIKKDIMTMIEKTSLAEMSKSVKEGTSYLKN